MIIVLNMVSNTVPSTLNLDKNLPLENLRLVFPATLIELELGFTGIYSSGQNPQIKEHKH